jgi:hypothetical protein
VTTQFARCRRLDVLINGLRERFPLVVHVGGGIIKRYILPFVPLPGSDVFLSRLIEPKGSVGTDDLTLMVRGTVGESRSDCYSRSPILVANERGVCVPISLMGLAELGQTTSVCWSIFATASSPRCSSSQPRRGTSSSTGE